MNFQKRLSRSEHDIIWRRERPEVRLPAVLTALRRLAFPITPSGILKNIRNRLFHDDVCDLCGACHRFYIPLAQCSLVGHSRRL